MMTVILGIASFFSSCKKEDFKAVRADTLINSTAACEVKSITKIYDADKHAAFTDFIRWSGNWYIVFRTSKGHAYVDKGAIKIMRSTDGNKWDTLVSYADTAVDLRDPKFIITKDNKLKVYSQGVRFNPDKTVQYQKGVIIDADSNLFRISKPYNIEYDRKKYWPWRFTVAPGGEAYAVGYAQDPTVFELVKTSDYKQMEDVCDLSSMTRTPTEATIRFRNQKCYLLARRAGPAMLGISNISEICNFKWIELPLMGLGGPNFLFYDDNTLLISGRDYASPDFNYASSRTSLFVYKIKQNKTYRILTLPTGGDTSYPGLYLSGDELWISYHSTHEGSTKVYLAKTLLNLKDL